MNYCLIPVYRFEKDRKTKNVVDSMPVEQHEFDLMNPYTWTKHNKGYAWASIPDENGKKHRVLAHRFIFDLKEGDPLEPHHKNKDRLDNRRSNLELTTKPDNLKSKKQYHKEHPKQQTIYKGVYKTKSGKFKAQISNQSKTEPLGLYIKLNDAGRAYNEAASLLYGDKADLNVIVEEYEDIDSMDKYIDKIEKYRADTYEQTNNMGEIYGEQGGCS